MATNTNASSSSSSSSSRSTVKHGDVVKFVTPELGGGPKDTVVGMTRYVIIKLDGY